MNTYGKKSHFVLKLKQHKKITLFFIILFFIILKSSTIFIMWRGLNIPVEMDDSYMYMYHINKVTALLQNNLSHFNESISYFSWSFFLGSFNAIAHIPIEKLYYYSFYFGIILMSFTLFFFIKSFFKNSFFLIFTCLFTVSFFTGAGLYHGFYWVVPSFYMLLLFFLIYILLNNNNKKYLYLYPVISIFYLFLHLIAPVTLIIYFLYFFIISFLEKKINVSLLKKIFYLYLMTGFWLMLYYFLNKKGIIFNFFDLQNFIQDSLSKSSTLNTNGLVIQTTENTLGIKNILKKILYFNKSEILLIYQYYIKKLVFNAAMCIPFVSGIFFLFQRKKYKLLSLYFAILVLIILLLKAVYASRLLILLWPVTYIIIGCGFYNLYKIIFIHKPLAAKSGFLEKTFASYLLKGAFVLCLVFFILYNTGWTYNRIKYSRVNLKNFNWNRHLAVNLFSNTDENNVIYFDNKTTMSAILSHSQHIPAWKYIDELLEQSNQEKIITFICSETYAEQIKNKLPHVKIQSQQNAGYFKIFLLEF